MLSTLLKKYVLLCLKDVKVHVIRVCYHSLCIYTGSQEIIKTTMVAYIIKHSPNEFSDLCLCICTSIVSCKSEMDTKYTVSAPLGVRNHSYSSLKAVGSIN